MSRVGKNPVVIPEGVQIQIAGQRVLAKGKLGQLSFDVPGDVEVGQSDGAIWVKPRTDSNKARALWGTARALVNNMVTGVSTGFTEVMEITGVGYRAAVEGQSLKLQLGYSHDVMFAIPEGIRIVCERPTSVAISGIDKQRVGQVAAEIRAFRPPEPYKGKGVKYAAEKILRKEGKKK